MAGTCGNNLTRGRRILVEGRLHYYAICEGDGGGVRYCS
ncbi:hypothetical protein [Pelosinus sp. IPA-1]|nr:hypothetical protein [Pelosinus sp. IPA-1]